MFGKRISTLLLLVVAAGAPCLANATTWNVTSGTIQIAQGCADPGCFSVAYSVDAGSVGSFSGFITENAGVLDFSITVSVFELDATAPTGLPGDAETIRFTSYTYSGVALPTSPSGGGFTAGIPGPAFGNATGTITSLDAFSAIVDIPHVDNDGPILTVTCGTPGANITCGFAFGPLLFSDSIDGATTYFLHDINVTASVPEPGSGIMAVMGLAFLAGYARRSRVC